MVGSSSNQQSLSLVDKGPIHYAIFVAQRVNITATRLAGLTWIKCCPFCGMHFQDASQMYHCLNCDTPADFSELDFRADKPDE